MLSFVLTVYQYSLYIATTGYTWALTSDSRSRGQCIVMDTVRRGKIVTAADHLTSKLHCWMLRYGFMDLPAIGVRNSPAAPRCVTCVPVQQCRQVFALTSVFNRNYSSSRSKLTFTALCTFITGTMLKGFALTSVVNRYSSSRCKHTFFQLCARPHFIPGNKYKYSKIKAKQSRAKASVLS